jgi:CheY-like chemotaxis protein
MFPYYHPTSILVVDDDASFLQSFRFFYGDRFNCLSFQRPGEALTYLNSIPAWAPARPLAPAHGSIDPVDFEPGDLVLQLKAGTLADVFADAGRFGLPSVAVVDYSMPGMTGIEFLEKVRDLPIRRLMLTGRADERTAIDAFNAGTIDSFFMKHEPNLTEVLASKIEKLQHRFFAEQTNTLASVLSLAAPFMSDPVFLETFLRESQRLGVIEYCVLTEPPGVLGRRADGKSVFLHVVDDDHRNAAIEIASEEDAPSELLDVLRQGNHAGLFPTANGFYSRSMASIWRSCVWPYTRVAGSQRFSVALVEEPGRLGLAPANAMTFDAFMEGSSGSA